LVRIWIITLYPDWVRTYGDMGVLARAQKEGSLELRVLSLRDFSLRKDRRVDDRPYGGGDGMILQLDPLVAAVRQTEGRVVALTPGGKSWDDQTARRWAEGGDWTLVCGRFGGFDQRFLDHYVQETYSIGSYILSGGELAALVLLDSVARFLPGALGSKESPKCDSFAPQWNGMLEPPQYTRPPSFEGHQVPEILTSGNHEQIQAWRKEESLKLTKKHRPDLIKHPLNAQHTN
jgi:tRNA (guanine37-N1)-methyltransferase